MYHTYSSVLLKLSSTSRDLNETMKDELISQISKFLGEIIQKKRKVMMTMRDVYYKSKESLLKGRDGGGPGRL